MIGTLVGGRVGDMVGTLVGNRVGTLVGGPVGASLGEREGTVVGKCEGADDGAAVTCAQKCPLALQSGTHSDGCWVGSSLGWSEGVGSGETQVRIRSNPEAGAVRDTPRIRRTSRV